MKRKKTPPSQNKGAPRWMVTYSDLVTLVLVFFILLFSMSQIDMQKFRAIADSFRDRNIFEFYPSAIQLDQPPQQILDGDGDNKELNSMTDAEKAEKEADKRLDNLLTEVSKYIDENDLQDIIVITRVERGVVLVLPEQILFNTSEAVILNSGLPFLNKVGSLLKDIPNIVKVEGHADGRQINTVQYPSNWELSTARASSVIRYFIEQFNIDPTRFIATGYAETRPVAPNDGPDNWQKNRRVEIVIMDPTYVDHEEGKTVTEE
ncbi:flagellar motor protein MotS [Bacillus kwashiorkori]|uniref:flagellar motor protein MotS n=1 Tax=Bacillus kwashiorkori TaxID=1522318 RepID=UPI000783695E|nr:flagellar motor protein MotS [Bacillus kwashiorkori]